MNVVFFVWKLEMCLALIAVSGDHRMVLAYLLLSSLEILDCNAENCNIRLSKIILNAVTSI